MNLSALAPLLFTVLLAAFALPALLVFFVVSR